MFIPRDQELLDYLKAQPRPISAKDVLEAYGLPAKFERAVRENLRELENRGLVAYYPGGRYGQPGQQPAQDRHSDGRPGNNRQSGQNHSGGAPKTQQKEYVNLIGRVVEQNGKLFIKPCNRQRDLLAIAPEKQHTVTAGDVVVVEPVSKEDRNSAVRVTKVLGRENERGILTTISLHEQGLSPVFSQAALTQARDPQLMVIPAIDENRVDLRDLPLVTIDGPNARDFDDAVFAEETADGFRLIVAIADVSYYVRPGDALDQDAYTRGNSTYFPDLVLPMLPEELSNGLCSLKPGVDRACLAFEMTIDKQGNLKSFDLKRGLMKSAARLTYEQVQAARDGQPDAVTAPLIDKVITPLYAAYEALDKARAARGTLDLDLPEHEVTINADGTPNVKSPGRLASHKLIEEFMITANVAAAKALESKSTPCVYRVHASPPSAIKLEQLREYATAFGINCPADLSTRGALRDILDQAAKLPHGEMIHNAVLRVQAKAEYNTVNTGHFGLALDSYAHFTSPIRRYADLLVHRLLVEAFNKGAGGIDAAQKTGLQDRAAHISETENLSAKAERNARDRYAIQSLIKAGTNLEGRIDSVSDAGLFVRLKNSGVTGLIPMRLLPKDTYDVNEAQHTVTGRTNKIVYQTGAAITVHVKDADSFSRSVTLQPVNDNSAVVSAPSFHKPIASGGPQPRNA